ncbi:MAG: Stp1/IreP family PP2C-type Ser/Thr phosphatase [Candidatus Hydrogenedentes bacterium]|nr:Stp1/IreP family PP2C-type Ser/Thr phosphatase [Candidatus Hydrogenedentota bacterium]MBI3118079.1 Stp1/IreP family PP2C-type Ser/Thr phosphatase [Candidatus Hydrogenedentota bacterium]
MRLDIAALTDKGRRKPNNEDYYGVFREDTPGLSLFSEGAMLCVADGLGGHTGGEIASKLTVSIIRDVLKEPPHPVSDSEDADIRDEGPFPSLRGAIQRANDSIHKTNSDLVKKGRPMGTTITVAIVTPKRVYLANVGDSRCYHFRDGEIIDRTEDHSWVDEQVRQGRMSKAEAETDLRRNIVTRCVGTHPDVAIDTYRWNIVPGDILLLCTDGLVNMVKDSEIKTEVQKDGTAADIAVRLVRLANENGGKDNITVIVANISPNPLRHLFLRLRSAFRRRHLTPLAVVYLFLYGLLCAAAGYALHMFRPLF